MPLLPKSRIVLLLGATLTLCSCADYLNNWDTVSFRAGDASEANTAIQEIEPLPKNLENTTIRY